MTEQEITQTNLLLAEELLSKGYYVHQVSRGATIDYLIVSTAPPQHISVNKMLADLANTKPCTDGSTEESMEEIRKLGVCV